MNYSAGRRDEEEDKCETVLGGSTSHLPVAWMVDIRDGEISDLINKVDGDETYQGSPEK